MRIIETPIAGAVILEPEPEWDERGFFARIMDRAAFAAKGLVVPDTQWSVSFNSRAGTLRGLHYQVSPDQEVKLVRCTAGAIFDVIVDVERRRWFSVELSAANRRALYISAGLAHGFQTLAAATEVFYAMRGSHEPGSARGIRWDDPALAIRWPDVEDRVMSERDKMLPFLPFGSIEAGPC